MEPEPAPNEIIKNEIAAIQKQARQLDPEDTDARDSELDKLEIKVRALRSFIQNKPGKKA